MRGARLAAIIAWSVLAVLLGFASAVAQTHRVAPLTVAEERVLKPKDSFKECDTCPEMVVVPAGSFTMGSHDSEPQISPTNGPQFSEGERPPHKVTFARQFATGKFAVTFDECDACVAVGGCNGYRPNDQGWDRGKRPVINVNWNDASAYVEYLSRKTGKSYRLLSEAEREYVTRAGTSNPFGCRALAYGIFRFYCYVTRRFSTRNLPDARAPESEVALKTTKPAICDCPASW
jgi:formylglycine-generating enzyme required for sulfatase activity